MTRRRAKVEWPTIALAIVIHAGWLATTWWHDRVPWWLLPAIGGWLVAWHGSLQHETIHGHPAGIAAIDRAIGSVPLTLWLPYAIYRRSHLAHHAATHVTDPFDDPESRYVVPCAGPIGRLRHIAARAQATLAGRLLFGPPLTIAQFLAGEARRVWRTPAAGLRDWLPHLLGVAVLLGWLRFCGLGLATYLPCFVYPGAALSLLRSFAEHRADPLPGRRVAVVERAGPFALLFLHNNLHAAHHRAPGLAWYRLPGYYRQRRTAILAGNGDLRYRGYGEVMRRYLFRAHDDPLHPDHAGGR